MSTFQTFPINSIADPEDSSACAHVVLLLYFPGQSIAVQSCVYTLVSFLEGDRPTPAEQEKA